MDFINDSRAALQEFSNAKLNIQSQQAESREWTSRKSLALGSPGKRSPTSTQTLDWFNPAAIESELRDFKELFSKLKVTYLEQETKETFLRIILDERDGDAIQSGKTNQDLMMWKIGDKDIDEATERNRKLKEVLAGKKEALQAASDEIRSLVTEACEKYATLKSETSEAELLLQDMEGMRVQLDELEKAERESTMVANQNLSYSETAQLYNDLKASESQLDEDIRNLRDVVIPAKNQELSRLDSSLSNLTKLKLKLEEAACMAVEVRQAELKEGKIVAKENIGQWYANNLLTLKTMLGIENLEINDESDQLVLSCRSIKNRHYRVKLWFNKGRFYNATVLEPSLPDTAQLIDTAVQLNDAAYFMNQIKIIIDH